MAEQTKHHPFIEDLGDGVTLESSILRKTIRGKELVLKVVKAGATQYATQTPRFLGSMGERSFFEYDANLVDGRSAVGLVSILRNRAGEVTNLNITFSPLDAVLSIAAGVRDKLSHELGAELFL
ncbi:MULTISPECIES: hypothetical protein [unclassified Caballeronia]|uniref:hypothetical protein n=1 Tax=unclassified Caballeronia TaxID=2646786 RepID=UPI0020280853|nr:MULTISPECIES: hypothetical protein [unclassified Caballeronia]